jgi:hypothetical protein
VLEQQVKVIVAALVEETMVVVEAVAELPLLVTMLLVVRVVMEGQGELLLLQVLQ